MASLIQNAFGDPVVMRQAYGEALVELGRARRDVVVLSADVSNSDFSYMFESAFPERFFNVGIAEPALVDTAVGLANSGLVPIANTFAFLFATRALEMVRTHLCYGRVNVKLAGAYAGVSDSFDGPTHHAITDLAILRSLPNMTHRGSGGPARGGPFVAAGCRLGRTSLFSALPQRSPSNLHGRLPTGNRQRNHAARWRRRNDHRVRGDGLAVH